MFKWACESGVSRARVKLAVMGPDQTAMANTPPMSGRDAGDTVLAAGKAVAPLAVSVAMRKLPSSPFKQTLRAADQYDTTASAKGGLEEYRQRRAAGVPAHEALVGTWLSSFAPPHMLTPDMRPPPAAARAPSAAPSGPIRPTTPAPMVSKRVY